MKSCLESLNSGVALLTKLTINLSGANPAPGSGDLNFDTILTDIKGNISDLNINLSGS